MDATLLAAAAAELRRRAVGARVERVSQPGPALIVLHLWGADPEARLLLLSADPALARVHLTWQRRENPPVPPPFCLLLRRHVEGAKLVAVEQPGLERVLYLHFLTRDDLGSPARKTLIAQLLGPRSDLALTAADGRVLGSLRQRIPTGGPYAPPPPQAGKLDPTTAAPEDVRAALRHGEPSQVVAGVSPRLGRALAGDADGLLDTIDEAREGRLTPPLARAWSLPPGPPDEVGRACDAAFGEREAQARLTAARARVLDAVRAHLRRASRKLALQEEELRQAEAADELRRRGELLLCHLHAVPAGAQRVSLPALEDPQQRVDVELDPRLSPADNAQAIFRRYRKAQRARDHLDRQIGETRAELAYLEDAERAALQAETTADSAAVEEELVAEGYLRPGPSRTAGRPRRPSPPEPLRVALDAGWEALIGKNAAQNDWLTMKAARAGDWWLHAKSIPGSHVVLRGPDDSAADPPAAVMARAAALAAYYSSARQGSHVPVDYTQRRHVWKPRGARPGFVLYRHEHTLAVDPQGPQAPRA